MFVTGFSREGDGYHCGIHMLVTGHPGKEARSLVYPAEIEIFICQRHMDLPNSTHPCQRRGSQACRVGIHTIFLGRTKGSTQESPTERFSVPCSEGWLSVLPNLRLWAWALELMRQVLELWSSVSSVWVSACPRQRGWEWAAVAVALDRATEHTAAPSRGGAIQGQPWRFPR